MSVGFILLAIGGALIVGGALWSILANATGATRRLSYVPLFFGVIYVIVAGVILAGTPTGGSWEVIPPYGIYQGKVVLVGEERSPYEDKVLLMLWLPDDSVKTYEISKDRFFESEELVSSDAFVDVRVLRPAEYDHRMLKLVPQAP